MLFSLTPITSYSIRFLVAYLFIFCRALYCRLNRSPQSIFIFSWMVVTTFPWSAISSLSSIISDSHFSSIVISFCFFHLAGQSLFGRSIFIKCPVDLSLEDKKAAQLFALLYISNRCTLSWVSDTQSPIASKLWKKCHDCSLGMTYIY